MEKKIIEVVVLVSCIVFILGAQTVFGLTWTRGTTYFNNLYCELTGCNMTGNLYTTGNVTANFLLGTELIISGNAEIRGDLDVTGRATSGSLETGEGNFTGNLKAKSGIELNGTLNDTDTGTHFYFDPSGALIIHLEN